MVDGSQEPELWLWLREGLCNRLRVLFSAIGLGQLTGRQIIVHWSTSPGGKIIPLLTGRSHKPFNADIGDLFDPEGTPGVRFVERRAWRRAVRSPSFVEAPMPPVVSCDVQHLWLDTYDDFYSILPDSPAVYARKLQVTDEIERWTQTVLARFAGGAPKVGFHIRSTAAHGATREHSSIEWFEARIAELLEERAKGEAIFLSTDSADYASRLHARFPGRLIESLAPPKYNSKRGIQKGLVDLTVLAASEHIVGSYFSSFSDMAFDLQGKRSYEDSQQTKGIGGPRDSFGPWARPAALVASQTRKK